MRLLPVLPLLAGAIVPGAAPTAAQTDGPVPRHVGTATCAGCHAEVVEAWEDSHHAWAWKTPDATSVLGDFDDARFAHRGVTTRFTTRDGRYHVETDGPDGAPTEYEIKAAVGVAPLQQYLVETEPGRLQALDLAWDHVEKRWYHLYPDEDLPAGDGLHWTGPYKNWNARCAECHATGYHKNYDPQSRAYASTEAEIGVGCEACHGPGEAHVAWAQEADAYDDARWPGLTPEGFTIGFTEDTPRTEIQQCAGCHSRREAIGDSSPMPGTPFHDAYRLSLLREGLYHPDGAIRDEVYVYGSFLQSKMYARGVRCSDCHDPHTATLKAEGNAVCTQCHSPAENRRFPTLKKVEYDDPSHHFHVPGSAGAECKSCHMIERVYMGIDGRRDHSFRIPRPDLSMQTGAPNACTDCHTNRDAAWAAAEIASRFPETDRSGAHFSHYFSAARYDPAAVGRELMGIAAYDALPGVTRATALDLVTGAANEALAADAASLLQDPDPLVRAAAVGVQRAASPVDRVQRLVPMLEDPIKSVRLAAARELLDAPIMSLPPDTAVNFDAAMDEWRDSLQAKADFPEAQIAIAGTALALRNFDAAEQAFREAVRLDPQAVEAWVMIVRILAATGEWDGAGQALDDALAANPENRMLRSLRQEVEGARPR